MYNSSASKNNLLSKKLHGNGMPATILTSSLPDRELSQRKLSIDAFRGNTILVMIFVNELASVPEIPQWITFFKPAGSNPLLTYIIPDIIYFLTALSGVSLIPDSLIYGVTGLLWFVCFAVAIMGIVILLDRIKFRLQW